MRDFWRGFGAVLKVEFDGFPQILQGLFFCRAEAGNVVIETLCNEVVVLKVKGVMKRSHGDHFV